mmetsp:Transcript_1815/g.3282  ORF Transcript_1815/g.3282 Transcript_1815/m.3282 type:complete len:103 (-) Transcript_1815:987-1295(-)
MHALQLQRAQQQMLPEKMSFHFWQATTYARGLVSQSFDHYGLQRQLFESLDEPSVVGNNVQWWDTDSNSITSHNILEIGGISSQQWYNSYRTAKRYHPLKGH